MEGDQPAATAQDNTAPVQQAPQVQQVEAIAPAPDAQAAAQESAAEQPAKASPAEYKSNLLAEEPAKEGQEPQAKDGQEPEQAGEDFEIVLPEGFTPDEEAVGALKEMVKEGGLSKEAAQKLADQHMKAIERYEAYRLTEGQKQIEAWEKEVREHSEFGGAKLAENVANARLMLQKYGSPKLKEDFTRMGVISHPEFIYMLMKMHRDVSEGASIGGAGQAMPERSAAKVLFPDFK